MKTKRLIQWYGSNTENCTKIGEILGDRKFVGIPFAGGMTELPYISAKQILVNDTHKHIINLCMAIKDQESCKYIIKSASQLPYHPEILKQAQQIAKDWNPPTDWRNYCKETALWYFVATWMNRGGKAGTNKEFEGNLPVRWNANGGGSNKRYRTAIEHLIEWNKTFKRCEFLCIDGLKFIEKFPDRKDNGLYIDPPWPEVGDLYNNKFTDHKKLSELLSNFRFTCVVIRYGDDQLIRDLYKDWNIIHLDSRNQANIRNGELIIYNERVRLLETTSRLF